MLPWAIQSTYIVSNACAVSSTTSRDNIANLGSLHSCMQNGYQDNQRYKARDPAVDRERREPSGLKVFHQEFCTYEGGDTRKRYTQKNEAQGRKCGQRIKQLWYLQQGCRADNRPT